MICSTPDRYKCQSGVKHGCDDRKTPNGPVTSCHQFAGRVATVVLQYFNCIEFYAVDLGFLFAHLF